MPFDSLSQLVQNFENPSGDPTRLNYAYDSTHTASGLYQITDTLWHAFAPSAGVDASLYPSAASAPASTQDAVFGQIVASHGLADWTCPGCDAPLTNYLANNPSAANLPVFAGGQPSGDGSALSPYGGDGGASVGAGGPSSVTQPGSPADNVGSALSPTKWLSAIGSWFGSIASRAVLFVVALILLLGAFYLFGTNREAAPQ